MKILALALFAAAACSPFDPDLGNAPYKCGDVEPRCPEGYACDSSDPDPTRHVCVAPGGLTPDGGTSGFQCLDDSSIEPNDTFMMATETTLNGGAATMYRAGAALCPELDKDHWRFVVVTANTNVQLLVEWESGMPLSASILNAAGTSIGNASPMGDKAVRVCVPNLPAGSYFTSVFAASTVKNNFTMEITFVPNC